MALCPIEGLHLESTLEPDNQRFLDDCQRENTKRSLSAPGIKLRRLFYEQIFRSMLRTGDFLLLLNQALFD